MPFGFTSSTLLSVASGLYSLLQPGSPTGEWVGFQIIGGIGSGAGLQVVRQHPREKKKTPVCALLADPNPQAVNAIQAVTTGKELSSGIAFMVFCQALGPSIALVVYNVLFGASLKAELAQRAPNVDAQAIIDAGATGFRSLVRPEDLGAVLKAYANSINHVFYLVAALAACCSIFVWPMGWYDVTKKSRPEDVTEPEGAAQEEKST